MPSLNEVSLFILQMKKDSLLFAFTKTNSPVAYCILSIGMGTRDEDPKYNGLAHLTEHMLFKGTPNRSSVNISSTLEKVGGDLNAFTTKERIVLYSTTLKEDVKKAVGLIFELAFKSTFPEDELKKEKEVIYDEIITYQDSPSELLFDTFEADLFDGTPLGYTILGDKKTLDPVTPAVLAKNRDKYFVPGNMTFTVAGDFRQDEIEAIVQKELEAWCPGAKLSQNYGKVPMTSRGFAGKMLDGEGENKLEFLEGKKFDRCVDKKLRLAHCVVGCTAYSYYERRKRAALSLISNMLGGPASNSRLSLSLREKHALVYHIDASCVSYKDTGLFCIYFGCDKKYLDKCMKLMWKELDKFVAEPLTPRVLAAAKKQMVGQLAISGDNAEAKSLTVGKSLLLTGNITSLEKIRSEIEAVTAEEIQEVAKEILSRSRMSRLVFY